MLTARPSQTEGIAKQKDAPVQKHPATRRLDRFAKGPSVEALIAEERARSHEFGGRSVFGWEPSPKDLNERTG
jgi:uncharacterized protein